MRNAAFVVALLLLRTAFAYAQGELAPSIDAGPLKMAPETPLSDEPAPPKPDSEGVYSIGPRIGLPVLLHAVEAVDLEDAPDCDPPVVVVAVVIGDDGRADTREFFTPRSSPCARLTAQAIKQYRFQPATLNHQAISVRACLSVSFRPDQLTLPVFTRCPRRAIGEREEDEPSPAIETQPTTHGREVAQTTTGPMNMKMAAPVPDEHGVYSLGPGIVSPVLKTAALAGPPDAVARCRHPVIVAAVFNTDGTIRVRGIYQVYDSDEKACDDLALAAVQQSRVQPATLNGAPVPVAVCLGLPFARPVPPTVRPIVCPRNMGATPLNSAETVAPPAGAKAPVVIDEPQFLQYTFEARKKKIQGIVRISVLVTEEGLPTDPRVEQSLGYGLDEIALDAARHYRFQPATVEGKAVPARITVEVNFKLEEK